MRLLASAGMRGADPYCCFQRVVPCHVGNATAVFTLEILVVCLILYQWDLLLHKIDCSVEQRRKYKGKLSHWLYLDVFSHTFVGERRILDRRKANSSLSVSGRQKV